MKELIKIAKEREYMTLIAGIDAENEKYCLASKLWICSCRDNKKAGYKFNKWLDLAFISWNLTVLKIL